MNIKTLGWLTLLTSVLFGTNALAHSDDSRSMDKALSQEMVAKTEVRTPQEFPATDSSTSVTATSTKLSINSASAAQIAEALKGVGAKKAEAIVAYRDKLGGFKRIEQLLDVKGIGEATLEKNRPFIML